jgi:hypothetical protein
MTDHDLATLVRAHVSHDEPPFLLSPETSIALGRRTLVRRRARRGLAGVLVAAAAVVAVPLVPWGGSSGSGDGDRTGLDVATARALEHYDARSMPTLIDQHTRAALGDGLEGLGQAEFTAFDDQGQRLPVRYYDKASGMSVAFRGTGDRRVEVTLLHARSEAEGDARKNCAEDLAGGIDFSCTVTTSAAGDPITTTVRAVRPMSKDVGGAGWALLTPDELSSGIADDTSPGGQGPIDPADVYFVRRVESVHSDTFLTGAEETVHAPSLAAADKLWEVPVADLATVATDPALVIPKPPLGPGGCPWTWKMKVTCSKTTG